MKRFILSLIPCVALAVCIGCGRSDETSVVETTVSDTDAAIEKNTMDEYNSDEYQQQMEQQSKKK